MNEDPVDQLLSGLETPAPPGALRERVLSAAHGAMTREAPRDVWTRLARSRPLRLGWAASVLLLLWANVQARTSPRSHAGHRAHGQGREVQVLARLPRIDDRVMPSVEATTSRQRSLATPVRKGAAS